MENGQALKEQGNALFQDGDLENAIACYSEAARISKEYRLSTAGCDVASQLQLESQICSNRALCELKLGRYADAEKSADESLKHDASNLKALWRRALAREHLGEEKIRGAVEDVESYLARKPSTPAAQRLLERLRKSLHKPAGFDKSSKSGMKEQFKVEWTEEKVGTGEIFDLYRLQYSVPRQALQHLKGDSQSINVRGGVFQLTVDRAAGILETVVETPNPTPLAEALADRINSRMNASEQAPGLDAVCTVQ